jgi:hypothetical protein
VSRWSFVRSVKVRWAVAIGVTTAALALALVVQFGGDPEGSPVSTVASADDEGPGFDSPGEAMEWILMSHRNEDGSIPRNGLMRARAQADEMRRVSRAAAAAGEERPTAAGIVREGWTWIGPTNIGGRVRGLAILPNAQTLITGGVAGGIWKSDNAGLSWRVIDDFMANLAVSTIVFRPGESSRLFAGTGEGFFNADSIRGAGIFVSADAGESWTQLPSTANVDFDFVNRLAFSSDGSILMAATRTGLFRSTNLGVSWSLVFSQSNMLDVKFIAGSTSQVVASGRNRNAFHSTNGGQSWAASGGLVSAGTTARVELGVATSAPNIVFASVDASSGEVWKSTDNGVTYTQISTPAHLSSQGWYDNAIWVDPTNPDLVLAGGVSVFRSTNGGVNFSTAPSCHVDQHIIIHDPGYNGTSNRRVYLGSDGGVCRMNDVTVNAVTSLRNGLGITQFYGGGGNAASGRIMGGTQDNGTLRYDVGAGTNVWAVQFGADGGFSAVDPTDANILYGETQNFRLHRSLTGGTPSQYIYGGSGSTSCAKPPPYQITDACNGTANFISPFILDPNEPNRLLAGGRSLWRSDDPRTPNTAATGPSWAAIKPPTASASNISAIAVAPGNADIVWIGHNNGEIYVSLNGTSLSPTWTRVDSVVLPNRVVNSIVVDPADVQVAYAAFGGFSPDSLWRTTNLGATWEDRTGSGAGGLPDAPVRSIVLHPQNTSWLYAATDVGIFASEDGGGAWSLPHDGPANVAVFQLFWMGTTLVAVTHGRGMYTVPSGSATPVFARRPLSQAVLPGHSVAFNVVVFGVSPISYQWYRGQAGDTTNPIAGATSPSYTTGPIQQNESYWVRATNALGSADSNSAALTLLAWGSLLPGTTNQGPAPEEAAAGARTAAAGPGRTSKEASSVGAAGVAGASGVAGPTAAARGASLSGSGWSGAAVRPGVMWQAPAVAPAPVAAPAPLFEASLSDARGVAANGAVRTPAPSTDPRREEEAVSAPEMETRPKLAAGPDASAAPVNQTIGSPAVRRGGSGDRREGTTPMAATALDPAEPSPTPVPVEASRAWIPVALILLGLALYRWGRA